MDRIVDINNHYGDFPPGLDTPFNHMVAYLIRTVDDPQDFGFVDQLKHVFHFNDLSETDKMNMCFLLSEYGYFDAPKGGSVSMETLLENVRRMIEEEQKR